MCQLVWRIPCPLPEAKALLSHKESLQGVPLHNQHFGVAQNRRPQKGNPPRIGRFPVGFPLHGTHKGGPPKEDSRHGGMLVLGFLSDPDFGRIARLDMSQREFRKVQGEALRPIDEPIGLSLFTDPWVFQKARPPVLNKQGPISCAKGQNQVASRKEVTQAQWHSPDAFLFGFPTHAYPKQGFNSFSTRTFGQGRGCGFWEPFCST